MASRVEPRRPRAEFRRLQVPPGVATMVARIAAVVYLTEEDCVTLLHCANLFGRKTASVERSASTR